MACNDTFLTSLLLLLYVYYALLLLSQSACRIAVLPQLS